MGRTPCSVSSFIKKGLKFGDMPTPGTICDSSVVETGRQKIDLDDDDVALRALSARSVRADPE
jgi:hypothetical protein